MGRAHRWFVGYLSLLILGGLAALWSWGASAATLLAALLALGTSAVAGWMVGVWHERRRLSRVEQESAASLAPGGGAWAGALIGLAPVIAVPVTARMLGSYAYVIVLTAFLTAMIFMTTAVLRERQRAEGRTT